MLHAARGAMGIAPPQTRPRAILITPLGMLVLRLQTLSGAMGIRTPDLLNAIEALYQLSYDPDRSK